MPRQTSFQMSKATARQIEALKAQGYGTTIDIIRIAIDRMWMRESFAGEHSAADMADIEDDEGENNTE